MLNILFLIIGLVLGFVFAYILERFKEGRLRKKVAIMIKNEITNCGNSAKKELENLERINCIPPDIQKERVYLGAFALSLEFLALFSLKPT